ncbi:protein-N(5)-glutamine methyltransferase PrmC [Halorhodospira halochloris]|uniref:Release factor glutamine methyltransferase n=1 Tax=Halorhodospira halochloris TaxID=1052 RepID=A0A110B4H1_HALHR|nr:peptide chain release factor N(5)-glutamine methyltransferase [Halorhodospira halochloris]MBK1651004.1 protein-(glutamine-N5) methyltransferase, release factor-specific [Halorhodospira halochloris]BAU56487.1 protein-N(5)-glutamine methyltransferase PrmC [Halorhodospira halochloris]
MTSLGEALKKGERLLEDLSSTPRLDAELLLCHVLGRPRSYLYAYLEQQFDETTRQAYLALIERRRCKEPVAYILGTCEFWGLELEVSPAVLIPRPETEHLVEAAIAVLPHAGRLLDLGTGSGAIALAIAQSRPDAQVNALDSSQSALAIARNNRDRLRLNHVDIRLGDWNTGISGSYDVIVANPPYVEEIADEWSSGSLQWEPREALAAGCDGLAAIRKLIPAARGALAPQGYLLIEHGASQAAAVRAILAAENFHAIETIRDLAGLERITLGLVNQ